MKRLLLLFVGLAVGALGVNGQNLPIHVLRHTRMPAGELCRTSGSVWKENEDLLILVGTTERLVLFRNSEITWQSDSLGPISAATSIDFGRGEGTEIICTSRGSYFSYDDPYVWFENTTYFSGQNFSETYHDSAEGEWFSQMGRCSRTRTTTWLSHFPDQFPDSSRSIIKNYNSVESNSGPGWNGTATVNLLKGKFLLIDDDDQMDLCYPGNSSNWFSTENGEQSGNERSSIIYISSNNNEIGEFLLSGSEDQDTTNFGRKCLGIEHVQIDGRDLILAATDRYFILFAPSNNEIVRLVPTDRDTIMAMHAYRRPENDSSDEFIFVMEGNGRLSVYSLPQLQLIYRMARFTTFPLGLHIGDYTGDSELEMVVIARESFGFYSLGRLDVTVSPEFIPHPSSLILSSFPNPFNSSTTISYSLPSPGRYAIDVIDIQGRLVTRLSDGWREAGSYREVFEGNGLTSGNYFLQIENGNNKISKPIALIK